MAQDFYSSGYLVNPLGHKMAVVFKNDEVFFEKEEAERDSYSTAIVMDTMTGDIYWANNSFPVNSISESFGRVMKNEEVLLENQLGTYINALSLDGNDIYSAGYFNDIYESRAAVWKNDRATPLYTYGTAGNRSEVLGMVVVDGVVYACGYYENRVRYGCVWMNGDLYASYPYETVRDIAYYEGDLYYVVGDISSTIYKSGQELFSLYDGDGSAQVVNDMKVVDGDVYSVGFMGFNDCFVWKNADFLYIHPFGMDADFRAIYYHGNSLYYVGWDHEGNGVVFRDGEQIYSLKSFYLNDVFVLSNPLAVGEGQKETLVVCPNPAKERIKLEGLNNDDVVAIFNATGQLEKVVAADPDKTIDISNLTPGLYVIRCGAYNWRFIKE